MRKTTFLIIKKQDKVLSKQTIPSLRTDAYKLNTGLWPNYEITAYKSIESARKSLISQRKPLIIFGELQSLGSPKKIKEFTIVSSFDIHPKMQMHNFPLDALLHTPVEDDEVRREQREIQRDDYKLVAPRLVCYITSRFSRDSASFIDGSRFEDRTGFGVLAF
jgi:hypothetical protein